MMPHTILHLTGMQSAKYGAMEHYVAETVRSCLRRGYRSVVQYESQPRSPEYLETLRAAQADLIVLETAGRTAQHVRRLWRLIRRVRPVLIQTHFPERYVVAAACLFGRVSGTTRVISMVHNVHGLTPRSLARLAYNRCDLVLAVSEGVRHDLLAGAVRPGLIRTHYLGLFGERHPSPELRARFRQELGIPPEAIVMGNIAFDAPFKGVDLLLDAFQPVAAREPRLHLVQVGIDPAVSSLPAQAGRLGLSARVHWAGIRDRGWEVLNAADFYVQPSRYGEGLPLAIMEAMALDLPVLATRVSGNQEAVVEGETGFLVEPGGVGPLVEGIERMLDQADRWPSLGRAGRSRFRQLFDGAASVERLVEEYYQLDRTE
jgi:glycosyltransferase involved in cell wall biosynthesis